MSEQPDRAWSQGPWVRGEGRDQFDVFDPWGNSLLDNLSEFTRIPNAALCALAPEMAEALLAARSDMEGYHPTTIEEIKNGAGTDSTIWHLADKLRQIGTGDET